MKPFAFALIAALALTACASQERKRYAVPFDGVYFRATAKPIEKDRQAFEVRVHDASQTLEGATEAGRFEATKYCINFYGTSNIIWASGPDADADTFEFNDDTLIFRGTCAP